MIWLKFCNELLCRSDLLLENYRVKFGALSAARTGSCLADESVGAAVPNLHPAV